MRNQKIYRNYRIGLFESAGDYVVFLVGVNSYEKENTTLTLIEFEPSNMYFRLPKNEYKNLNRKQLLNKLTSQLKDFTNTTQFKLSFIAEAKSITTDFNGEIWSGSKRTP